MDTVGRTAVRTEGNGRSASLGTVAEQATCGPTPVLDATAGTEAGADDDLVVRGAQLLNRVDRRDLGRRPAAPVALYRGRTGPAAYFAVAHGAETLDDVALALVDKSAAEKVGQKRRRRSATVHESAHRQLPPPRR